MRWIQLLITTGLTFIAPPLFACSIVVAPHVVDPRLQDNAAPALTTVGVGEIVRGRGPAEVRGSFVVSSCDDMGRLTLHIQASDSGEGAESLGVEIRAGDGSPPFFNIEEALSLGEGQVTLYWGDGATNQQESLDFTLTLRVVDEAGNLSPWSQPVHVVHESGS